MNYLSTCGSKLIHVKCRKWAQNKHEITTAVKLRGNDLDPFAQIYACWRWWWWWWWWWVGGGGGGGGGGHETNFLRSVISRLFTVVKILGSLLNIAFIFDRCHRSWAVKYESDSKNLTGTFPKYFIELISKCNISPQDCAQCWRPNAPIFYMEVLLITQMYLRHRLSTLLQLNLHSRLNTWLQWIWQRQLWDDTRCV